MTAVENKIPDFSNLIKITDCDTKISETEKQITDHNRDKYITTAQINKLTAENFASRLSQANLVTKTNSDTKLISLNRKINSNKTKHLLFENELEKLQTFDSSYIQRKSHFEEDGAGNYLIFQPINRCFKRIIGVGNGEYILFLEI